MIGQLFISLIGIDNQTKRYQHQASKLEKARMELMYANPYRRHLNLKARIRNIDYTLNVMETVFMFGLLATGNNISSKKQQPNKQLTETLGAKRRLLETEYNNCIKPTEVKGGFTK